MGLKELTLIHILVRFSLIRFLSSLSISQHYLLSIRCVPGTQVDAAEVR